LKKRANINAKTHTGIPAISYAILNEDIPMIKLMLDKRKGKIEFNYDVFGNPSGLIDEIEENAPQNPEIAKILKEYVVSQTLPKHYERQHKRLEVGRKMDANRMPGDLTHKIITENFGGKRTRKTKKSNKNTRKK